jgi:hypothetical protein
MSLKLRGYWLAGAMLIGLMSQYCVNYGVCALPL